MGIRGKEKGGGREKVGEEWARQKDKDTATLGASGVERGNEEKGFWEEMSSRGFSRSLECMICEKPCITSTEPDCPSTKNPNANPSFDVRTVPESHNTYGRTTLRHHNFNAVGLTRVAQ